MVKLNPGKFLKAGGVAIMMLALPLLSSGSPYLTYVLCLAIVYSIAAVGLNLMVGMAGLISLGHAAFMAIGAYTSAMLTVRLHLPFVVALPASAVVAGLCGYLLGLPALRLRGPYLVLATISFGAALPEIIAKGGRFTGGYMGMHVAKPNLGPLVLRSEMYIYYLELAVGALLVWFATNLLQSRYGRSWRSLRESQIASQSLGVNLALAKTGVFALGAAYAGIAGSLYAHLVGFISPLDFNVFMSFQLLAMIVVGGMDSVVGSVIGATAITLLLQAVSRWKGFVTIIEGIVIIAMVWLLPSGLISVSKTLGQWRAGKTARGPGAEPTVPMEETVQEEVAGRGSA